MFDQKISTFDDLPIDQTNRKRTDICCTIIAAIFSITMLVLAIILLDTENYQRSNYPTDSDSQPCAYGPNADYPFLYFPNIKDASTRVCLSHCPSAGDFQLTCRTNSKVRSCAVPNIYESSVNFDRLGGFCTPTDSAAQQTLNETANLKDKWSFLQIFDSILYSLLIALGVGLIWVFLVQCLPRPMTAVVTILGVLVLAAVGVILLVDGSSGIPTLWRIVIGVILLAVALLFFSFLCFYRKRNRLIGIFIDWSTKYFSQHFPHIFWTFIFIIFTAGLVVLCLFQHVAFTSHSTPQTQQNDIFLKLSINPALFILNLIEFIWGLQFLKDSYNFILSGLSSQWYCQKSQVSACLTFSRLLRCHFGSVVGGSFLNAFFNLIDFLLEALRCYPDGACPACASCCDCMLGCCGDIFDLVRTDVYAYINLTGIAYCNAARNCEHLISESTLFVGSQSLLYFYRISAYCFTIGVVLIVSYFIQKQKLQGNANLVSLLSIAFFAYCVLNWFVDLHANLAEGIQISYLIESGLGSGGRRKTDPYDYKSQIQKMQTDFEDGHFC